MAKNIGQSGRPVLIFNAGANPENVEPCVERRYFSKACYLALTCEDDALRARLQARPGWREAGDDAFIEGQQKYNALLKTHASIESSIDTTNASLEESVSAVTEWVRRMVL